MGRGEAGWKNGCARCWGHTGAARFSVCCWKSDVGLNPRQDDVCRGVTLSIPGSGGLVYEGWSQPQHVDRHTDTHERGGGAASTARLFFALAVGVAACCSEEGEHLSHTVCEPPAAAALSWGRIEKEGEGRTWNRAVDMRFSFSLACARICAVAVLAPTPTDDMIQNV